MTSPRNEWAEKQCKRNVDNECTRLMHKVIALAEFHPAPLKTSWGDGMRVADIALSKDETVFIYVHEEDLHKIKCLTYDPK